MNEVEKKLKGLALEIKELIVPIRPEPPHLNELDMRKRFEVKREFEKKSLEFKNWESIIRKKIVLQSEYQNIRESFIFSLIAKEFELLGFETEKNLKFENYEIDSVPEEAYPTSICFECLGDLKQILSIYDEKHTHVCLHLQEFGNCRYSFLIQDFETSKEDQVQNFYCNEELIALKASENPKDHKKWELLNNICIALSKNEKLAKIEEWDEWVWPPKNGDIVYKEM